MNEPAALDGPEFYAEKAIFDVYMKHRHRKIDSPNDALEKPVIYDLIGSFDGLQILDLGCGDAAIGLDAIQQNCRSYLGIDGSQKMVDAGMNRLKNTNATVQLGNIENWEYPINSFDLVTARLSLHYIHRLQEVITKVFDALVVGGKFVFSVEHPVITSCSRGWRPNTPRQDWLVDDYFQTGQRTTSWLGGRVIKYHRTVEEYYAILKRAGFIISDLREGAPIRENFQKEANFSRRQRIPLFLIISAEKPI